MIGGHFAYRDGMVALYIVPAMFAINRFKVEVAYLAK